MVTVKAEINTRRAGWADVTAKPRENGRLTVQNTSHNKHWETNYILYVQMNVVPRSTGNTNSGTRELTLKCKLKCYFKPMNNPLGVSPSKGKQGTTRGKEKIF